MIIGKKILRYKKIDSTNDEAKRLIKEKAIGEGKGEWEGTVIVAEEQTSGRGKPGSSWFSPKGNLYVSVIIKPYKNPDDLSPLTLLAALAARSMIAKAAKLPAIIKWPNDLLVREEKVGGILIERLTSGHLIVGIGINVNTVPKGLTRPSTSLRLAAGRKFSLGNCVKVLLAEMDKVYLAYLSKV